MQKVLITGANGFVGFYLCRQLLESGFEVVATGKGACRLPFSQANFQYQSLDFTDREAVCRFFEIEKPQVVVHCGALSKPDECEAQRQQAFLVNVTGTIYLLDQAAKWGSFFVFLSTDFVFDGEKGMYREDDARKAVNYYGATKILAEDEVFKYEGNWAVVRTVLVYGKPFLCRQNIVSNVAAALQNGKELNIFSDQVRTPTYVEDLVAGIVAVVTKKATGIYHISGADILSPYDMAVAVAKILNLDASLIHKVQEQNFKQPARRPLKTGFNIARAKKILNYQPVTFEQGLEKTLSPE